MRRIIIASVCILTSVFGMAVSTAIALGAIANVASLPPFFNFLFFIFGILIIFSWFAFIKMCIGWVNDEAVGSFWVKYGTIAGGICILVFNVLSLAVLPAILLAIHVREFHIGLNNACFTQSTINA